jgi:hypothetical protein
MIENSHEIHAFLPANSSLLRTAEPVVMMLSMIGLFGSAVACFHCQSAGAFPT